MKSIKFLFIPIFLLFASIVFAQTYSDTTWERWYGEPNRHENPWHYQHAAHYDHGLLLLSYPDQNPYATILQKTDVNGKIIWTRYINASFQHALATITTSENGDIYIGGSHVRSNGVENALIIKLNSCGDLEWCKRFYIDPLKLSFLWDISIDKNGDIIGLIYGQSDFTFNGKTQIVKMSSNGEIYWHNTYITAEEYPTIVYCTMHRLNISMDNSYYLSGTTGFPDNYIPGEWLRYRATAVKISEDGKEEWMSPLGLYDEIGSFADQLFTFEDNGDIWGAIVADSAGGSQSGRFTFNEDGEILDYYFKPVLEGITAYNEFTLRRKIQNNLNAARFDYFLDPNSNVYNWGLIVFDNDFNVLSYKLDMDDYADSPFSTIMSHDSLLLDISSCYNCNGTQYSDVYIAKYNADLSFADTIDDTNWEYDYLCDYPILSDTIYLACDPIGVEELKPPVQKEAKELPIEIKASPNPAKNHIQLQLEYSEDFKNLSLQVFDIKGQEMYQEDVLSGVKELDIKTRKWESGMYIVILRSEDIMVGNTKFVIEK